MKSKILFSTLALASLVLTGCAGRFTGGGSVTQGEDITGQFNLQNISAADCDSNGEADHFRGTFDWRGANGKSFTCNVSNGFGGTVAGMGMFAGSVAKSKGYITSAPTECALIVMPAMGSWGLFVTTNSTEDAAPGPNDFGILSDFFAQLGLNFSGPNTHMAGAGFMDGGNINYHKENVNNGICPKTAG